MAGAILVVHTFATLLMSGLIWFVQLVHYPLFAKVGIESFVRYEQDHTRRVTWLAGPLMTLELASAIGLLLLTDEPIATGAAWAGLVLLAVIWTSTAVLQVPCHRRLSEAFEPLTAKRLVATNWVRTTAWTARSIVALYLCMGACSNP